jgi:hypothetical protein
MDPAVNLRPAKEPNTFDREEPNLLPLIGHRHHNNKESGMMQGKKKAKTRGRRPAKGSASERRASIRFFLIWGPVILLVIIALYALVFDPESPLGPPVTGVLAGADQQGSATQAPAKYSVVLDDSRQIEAAVTPTLGTQSVAFTKGRRVLLQESTTTIFRRHHFVILKTLD